MDSSVAYKRGYASSKYDLPSTRNSSKFEQQQARRIDHSCPCKFRKRRNFAFSSILPDAPCGEDWGPGEAKAADLIYIHIKRIRCVLGAVNRRSYANR